jgi:hypothetical protein
MRMYFSVAENHVQQADINLNAKHGSFQAHFSLAE